MTELATVFRALGDPVRLEMVKRLSAGESFTIAAVSKGFEISRQGARKHLQVLADADLVELKPKGRDVLVTLEPHVLEQANAFIAELETQWEVRLEALNSFVESERKLHSR